MSYFKAKMHQITALPDPLAEFHGPTSKGREGRGEEGREGRGGTPWFLLTPPDVKSWIKRSHWVLVCWW